MRLREIEMDLPYQKNDVFIKELQRKEKMGYEEAVRADYKLNCKEKRRNFQLMTRCMTAMIERIMEPIETIDCWKIIFECVDNCMDDQYKNCLGVYVIQVPFNVENFFEVSELERKKMIIEAVELGIKKLSTQVAFMLTAINQSCMRIKENGYRNEWIWKKIKIGNKFSYIQVMHEMNCVNIYIAFCDKSGNILKKELVTTAVSDERVYDEILGDLKKVSKNEVVLITKKGEKYSVLLNIGEEHKIQS